MTPDDFRKEVLRLKGAEEKSHMGHPDFRVKGKIFATLGYPDQAWGMVRLTLEHQRMFIQSHPEVFSLVQGAPGLRGRTLVRLKTADVGIVQEALKTAWLARAPKPAGTETSSQRSATEKFDEIRAGRICCGRGSGIAWAVRPLVRRRCGRGCGRG